LVNFIGEGNHAILDESSIKPFLEHLDTFGKSKKNQDLRRSIEMAIKIEKGEITFKEHLQILKNAKSSFVSNKSSNDSINTSRERISNLNNESLHSIEDKGEAVSITQKIEMNIIINKRHLRFDESPNKNSNRETKENEYNSIEELINTMKADEAMKNIEAQKIIENPHHSNYAEEVYEQFIYNYDNDSEDEAKQPNEALEMVLSPCDKNETMIIPMTQLNNQNNDIAIENEVGIEDSAKLVDETNVLNPKPTELIYSPNLDSELELNKHQINHNSNLLVVNKNMLEEEESIELVGEKINIEVIENNLFEKKKIEFEPDVKVAEIEVGRENTLTAEEMIIQNKPIHSDVKTGNLTEKNHINNCKSSPQNETEIISSTVANSLVLVNEGKIVDGSQNSNPKQSEEGPIAKTKLTELGLDYKKEVMIEISNKELLKRKRNPPKSAASTSQKDPTPGIDRILTSTDLEVYVTNCLDNKGILSGTELIRQLQSISAIMNASKNDFFSDANLSIIYRIMAYAALHKIDSKNVKKSISELVEHFYHFLNLLDKKKLMNKIKTLMNELNIKEASSLLTEKKDKFIEITQKLSRKIETQKGSEISSCSKTKENTLKKSIRLQEKCNLTDKKSELKSKNRMKAFSSKKEPNKTSPNKSNLHYRNYEALDNISSNHENLYSSERFALERINEAFRDEYDSGEEIVNEFTTSTKVKSNDLSSQIMFKEGRVYKDFNEYSTSKQSKKKKQHLSKPKGKQKDEDDGKNKYSIDLAEDKDESPQFNILPSSITKLKRQIMEDIEFITNCKLEQIQQQQLREKIRSITTNIASIDLSNEHLVKILTNLIQSLERYTTFKRYDNLSKPSTKLLTEIQTKIISEIFSTDGSACFDIQMTVNREDTSDMLREINLLLDGDQEKKETHFPEKMDIEDEVISTPQPLSQDITMMNNNVNFNLNMNVNVNLTDNSSGNNKRVPIKIRKLYTLLNPMIFTKNDFSSESDFYEKIVRISFLDECIIKLNVKLNNLAIIDKDKKDKIFTKIHKSFQMFIVINYLTLLGKTSA